jgi:putative methionine-R-sulfoxide reductase with GAF domain
MDEQGELLHQIQIILESSDGRKAKIKRTAEAIRLFRNYRWVGIYDVTEKEIAAIAWSGRDAPAYPRFPVTRGLSSEAVACHRMIVSLDTYGDELPNFIRPSWDVVSFSYRCGFRIDRRTTG